MSSATIKVTVFKCPNCGAPVPAVRAGEHSCRYCRVSLTVEKADDPLARSPMRVFVG
jgi:hypothetical protein